MKKQQRETITTGQGGEKTTTGRTYTNMDPYICRRPISDQAKLSISRYGLLQT